MHFALNNRAMCAAGVRWQAEDVDNFLLMRFRPGRFSDMHRTAITALQRGRNALLTGQRFAQRIPCVIDALGLQL